jgi:membrane associated rhomboid family serine protease
VTVRRRFSLSGLQITRGALVILGIELGLSLVWLLSNPQARASMAEYLVASPAGVFERGRVWTLATTAFLEVDFIGLLLHALMMWMFVPTLERFWGTPRFLRFAAITTLVGNAVGVGVGYLLGGHWHGMPINGLDPFIYAAIVAFGVVYARQPVQFFGVLPLTGRQLMYGFIGFLLLFVVLQLDSKLVEGAAFAGAMVTAALMTSKRLNPGLAWNRWRIRRARAHLSVVTGGEPKPKPRPKDKWVN